MACPVTPDCLVVVGVGQWGGEAQEASITHTHTHTLSRLPVRTSTHYLSREKVCMELFCILENNFS